jgi:hypothetical protein
MRAPTQRHLQLIGRQVTSYFAQPSCRFGRISPPASTAAPPQPAPHLPRPPPSRLRQSPSPTARPRLCVLNYLCMASLLAIIPCGQVGPSPSTSLSLPAVGYALCIVQLCYTRYHFRLGSIPHPSLLLLLLSSFGNLTARHLSF